jgi:hypothetical protein
MVLPETVADYDRGQLAGLLGIGIEGRGPRPAFRSAWTNKKESRDAPDAFGAAFDSDAERHRRQVSECGGKTGRLPGSVCRPDRKLGANRVTNSPGFVTPGTSRRIVPFISLKVQVATQMRARARRVTRR